MTRSILHHPPPSSTGQPVYNPVDNPVEGGGEECRRKVFKKVRVRGDGNCFFKCISLAYNIPVPNLREIVASSIYKPQNFDAVKNWKELWCQCVTASPLDYEGEEGDEAALRVTHLRGVVVNSANPSEVTPSDLDTIYKNMLKKTYWGDEYCIKILSETLSLTMIIRNDESGRFWTPTPTGLKSTIFLNYEDDNHYNLLSVGDNYLTINKNFVTDK